VNDLFVQDGEPMTQTKEVVIWCDSELCGKWERFHHDSVRQARRVLKARGWLNFGIKDYCPECKKEQMALIKRMGK